MPKLDAPLSQLLDEPISELQVQRIWHGVQVPDEPFWRRRRWQLLAAPCALAAGISAGFAMPRAEAPAKLSSTTELHALGSRLSAAEATELMNEAVRARQRNDPAHAVSLLERVRKGASGSTEAALAGWSLARMRMTTDPARAALDIQRALQDELPEGLQEVVRARLVEAHALAGAKGAASAAAESYRAAYPHGRYLSEVERWTRVR